MIGKGLLALLTAYVLVLLLLVPFVEFSLVLLRLKLTEWVFAPAMVVSATIIWMTAINADDVVDRM